MSLDWTNLHTLIVRAHDRHKIPIGEVMRVTLQAAANGKFPLHKSDNSMLELSEPERNWLLQLAATAEQQAETRWWTKPPWTELRRVLANEPQFWQWFEGELGAPKTPLVTTPTPAAATQDKAGIPSPSIRDAIAQLMKEGMQPASTVLWDEFCDLVRDRCDGWKDQKNRVPKRGFSDKTIKEQYAGRR
jgi:hypothetical protein